ncbi:CCA tRNA nucleotidyltransferase [Amaricoccus sp.]|uniref:CCA tRNA nucleotidyltransferase n=1 Tax=Amaricoccus sp. TaxID=1872485 RepID=UPI001B4BA3F6|nr:CCA tRNA nucleotidyltransferase [Amaricoccus sp.]MBP7002369.1 CCA tRNA nucleotidyltransferase [Amaricoccus sp.]
MTDPDPDPERRRSPAPSAEADPASARPVAGQTGPDPAPADTADSGPARDAPARIDAPWLRAPGPRAVCALLEGAGRQALFVGGCVRDALLGRAPADIDVATDARPVEVIALAEAAGLRAAPTGIEHGTVTLVHGGAPVEVTTFRRDVATDGRRAVVAFSDDVVEDAGRRDFTMNALYARPDGAVVDPLGGLPDLRAGRVRFVGDPDARIAEDHLRILRFFRFHAWFGAPGGGIDAEGLAACAAGAEGVDRLSRERVGAEIARLLAAPDPAAALAAMAASGVLARVLPGADPRAIGPLAHVEAAGGWPPAWRRRLAALGPGPDWPDRLRLSRSDASGLAAVVEAGESPLAPAAAAFRFGPDAARDAALIRAAREGVAPAAGLEAELARGAAARLPLRAAELPLSGPPLGAALRRAEAAWLAADLRLSPEAVRAAALAGA